MNQVKFTQQINSGILNYRRAEYGQKIVSPLVPQLSWTRVFALLPGNQKDSP